MSEPRHREEDQEGLWGASSTPQNWGREEASPAEAGGGPEASHNAAGHGDEQRHLLALWHGKRNPRTGGWQLVLEGNHWVSGKVWFMQSEWLLMHLLFPLQNFKSSLRRFVWSIWDFVLGWNEIILYCERFLKWNPLHAYWGSYNLSSSSFPILRNISRNKVLKIKQQLLSLAWICPKVEKNKSTEVTIYAISCYILSL